MDKRSPQLPDVPTFKELGLDWVDGGYGGIGVPKSTPMEARRRLSDLWAVLNTDPEMKSSRPRRASTDRHQHRQGRPVHEGAHAAYVPVARRMGLLK
jgi:tripartite-type tricarboxylate transporter receptor subunit TctC